MFKVTFKFKSILTCLHNQNKNGLFEGRLLSSQPEQFKKYLKSSDRMEKSRHSKKVTFILIV